MFAATVSGHEVFRSRLFLDRRGKEIANERASRFKEVSQAVSLFYEGRLISNAHSEISKKRNYVFKQTEVGSKVQYFSYKLTYLFYDIVALSFNTFLPA